MLQKSFSTKHGRHYYYSSGTSADSRENEITWNEPIQSKGVSAAIDAALALRNRNQKEERCDEKKIVCKRFKSFSFRAMRSGLVKKIKTVLCCWQGALRKWTNIEMMYARSVQRQDVFKFCTSCKVHVNTFWSEMALMSYRIISLDLKRCTICT